MTTATAAFVASLRTAAELTGQTGKRYVNHVFSMRPAPAKSPFAGLWFCEIHCPANMWASTPLTDHELAYQSFEQLTFGPYKILRFRTTKANALRLSEMCAGSDLKERQLLTNQGFRNWSKNFGNAVTTAHKF
jgi:hypothetical protein